MRFGLLPAAALACAALTGCAPTTVNLKSSFNAQEARAMTQRGVNMITGSALIRQNGGGVVTCAGLPVTLLPKTAYAAERVAVIYGNTQQGYNPAYRVVTFTPNPAEFAQYVRKTTCDAQGRFAFGDVADGEFFVETSITWQVGYSLQGGNLMQAVSVNGGEAREVVLSP
jgi:hypothetical protein